MNIIKINASIVVAWSLFGAWGALVALPPASASELTLSHSQTSQLPADSGSLLTAIGEHQVMAAGRKVQDTQHAYLVYSAHDGEVILRPAPGGKIIGFTLSNAQGRFTPESPTEFQARTPWHDVVYDSTRKQIGSADLSFSGTYEDIRLGQIFPVGLSMSDLAEMLTHANYSPGLGIPAVELNLFAVPEPATWTLSGGSWAMAWLGVLRRRRRERPATSPVTGPSTPECRS